MKKILFRFIILILVVILPACSSRDIRPAINAPGNQDRQSFKICLLDTGVVDGQNWTEGVYQALVNSADDLDAEIHYQETDAFRDDVEKLLRSYSSQGCAVVVGHGAEFQGAAITVGETYPETVYFVLDSQIYDHNNLIGVSIDSRQTFYLMGVMAAEMGAGAGLVGGVEAMPVIGAFEGFINGAHAVNPDFSVTEVYLGSWTDVTGAKQAALDMIDDGADFVMPYAGVGDIGVYHAAVEENIWTFGDSESDTEQAPKNIVASVIGDYGPGMVKILSEIRAGTFSLTGNIVFDLVDADVVRVVYNQGSDNKVPQELQDQVEEIRAMIVAGGVE